MQIIVLNWEGQGEEKNKKVLYPKFSINKPEMIHSI